MKFRKPDWIVASEAELEGLLVGMTGEVNRKRTELNNELMAYFRLQLPKYKGSFDEDEGEDILDGINEFMSNNEIDKHPLSFPLTSGTDVHLIPITEHLQVKVIVTDEYFGDGDYSKYVMINFFMIDEHATKSDVDTLVEFIKEYLQ